MRLNQFLAACGLGSRRQCEALIEAGRVRVNGAPAHFGTRVDAGDEVSLDGARLQARTTGHVWLLHKPAGVVSTAHDPEGRPTVLQVMRRAGVTGRVFSVGRLDFETTGLLLWTDDGDLAWALTHPSRGVDKEYEARIATALDAAALQQLRHGLELDDGLTAPCEAHQEPQGRQTLVRLVLHEGRKRQVRRMLAALGAPVLALHRVRFGPVRLGNLAPGQVRAATAEERAALRHDAGVPPAGGHAATDRNAE